MVYLKQRQMPCLTEKSSVAAVGEVQSPQMSQSKTASTLLSLISEYESEIDRHPEQMTCDRLSGLLVRLFTIKRFAYCQFFQIEPNTAQIFN